MKRSPVLIKLSREHHTALVLSLRIARATDPADLAALGVSVPVIFQDELEVHFQEEENGLLPKLAAAGASDLVTRTLTEHRDMRHLVARISAGDLLALKPFGVMLKAHVQFEERELFATAESLLPAHYLEQHV